MESVTSVTLRNFRGFARLENLPLAPLTFLVGPNSSGKSSIADAILFMAQSGFLSLGATTPLWIGPLVDLGSFRDTVFRHETKRAIEIRVGMDTATVPEDPYLVEVATCINTTKDVPEGRMKQLSVRSLQPQHSVTLTRGPGRSEKFVATSSLNNHRASYDPQVTWSEIPHILSSLLNKSRKAGTVDLDVAILVTIQEIALGVQRVSSGRNPPQRSYSRDTGSTAGERARRLIDGIDASVLEARPARGRKHLRDHLVDGLETLGIADHLEATRIGDYHTEVRLRDNITKIASNLSEFGYGASQVMPVLEGCALPGPGPLFIEQPEIHLHPRAQGQLAQILCDTSKRRQMIVETHSEHMINRARRLIAEGKLAATDVIIHYIDRDADGSHVQTIGLDELGDFTADWPDGFYDERYHETMKIAEAQARKARR